MNGPWPIFCKELEGPLCCMQVLAIGRNVSALQKLVALDPRRVIAVNLTDVGSPLELLRASLQGEEVHPTFHDNQRGSENVSIRMIWWRNK